MQIGCKQPKHKYENVFIYSELNTNKLRHRIIKKEYPQIREKLWQESFWTKSYFLITTGGASIETIRKYIEKQGR